jgi:hypothetical protein
MFNVADVIVGLIATWVLGLAPALSIRYLWKKAPLSKRSATWIAGICCTFLAILFLILRLNLGEANAKISPAWILVFWVCRRIMMGKRRAPAQLARDLRVMIADPATPEDRRQLASEKLSLLEAKSLKHPTRPALATAEGSQTVERNQPPRHPARINLRPAVADTVKSGPGFKDATAKFDLELYEGAKPHFEAAAQAFAESGKSLKDLFAFLIQNFGEDIRPYAIRFALERGLTANLGAIR